MFILCVKLVNEFFVEKESNVKKEKKKKKKRKSSSEEKQNSSAKKMKVDEAKTSTVKSKCRIILFNSINTFNFINNRLLSNCT